LKALALCVVFTSSLRACTADLSGERDKLLSLINEYRQQNGLPPLHVSKALTTSAQLHSEDMALHDYFSHTSLDGRTFVDRIRQAGYTYNTPLGENIAAGIATAQYVFEAWKSSSPHNAAMLNPNFKVIGIGVAYNASAYFRYYWTADFGGYDDSGAVVNNRPPEVPEEPSGPASGYVGTSYAFSTSSTDPDGDSIQYTFDWGDGTCSTTGYLASGCVASLSHSWGKPGVYAVKVMATDNKGSSSSWSSSINFQVNPINQVNPSNSGVSLRTFEVVFTCNVDANISVFVDGTRYSLPATFRWLEGSAHEVSAESGHNFTDGGRYVFKGWDDGFQDNNRSIVVSGSMLFKAVYAAQYLLSVRLYPNEQEVARWCDAGATAWLSVNSTVMPQGDDVRLVFTGWSNGVSAQAVNVTVNEPVSLSAIWRRQFLLRVESAYGEVVGGGWYDESSDASVFVHPQILDCGNGTRRVFEFWVGEGPGSYSGRDLNVTIRVEAPFNETAVWGTQHLLALDSAHGHPTGAGWYDLLTRVNVSVEPLLYESPTARLRFSHWEDVEGEEVNRNASFEVVVSSPLVLRAVWTREFYLNVTSDYGETWGSGWYAEGTVARFGVRPPPRSLLVADVFEGWTGDVKLSTINATLIVDGPKSVVARWRRDYLALAAVFATTGTVTVAFVYFGRRGIQAFRRMSASFLRRLLQPVSRRGGRRPLTALRV
jgi:hypothetical protein